MENHHFQWENPLFLWSFSISMLNYQRVSHIYGFHCFSSSYIVPSVPSESGRCKRCKGAETNWPSMFSPNPLLGAQPSVADWWMMKLNCVCVSLLKLVLLQVCNNLSLIFWFEIVSQPRVFHSCFIYYSTMFFSTCSCVSCDAHWA